jgi:outer membrane lipoprotein-sorting protein
MDVRLSLRRCALLLALLPLAGCLSITRKQHGMRFSTATLKEASLEQLVQAVNANAGALRSFNAKIDMDYAVGGKKKGKITKYTEISGTMLLRKPGELRVVGLVPVVHNRMFDMVSDGKTFQIAIPGRNKFLVGTNQINVPSEHPLENLRPQHIFDALPLKEIDSQNEIAVLEGGMEIVKDPKTHQDAEQPDYEVIVIRREGGSWRLSRRIVFSRVDLLPYHQMIYNRQGEVETDVHYADYTTYGGIQFPSSIEIQRPIEEVGITLTVTKMNMNETLRDEQFQIVQPPGVTVINLDEKTKNAASIIEPGLAAKPH